MWLTSTFIPSILTTSESNSLLKNTGVRIFQTVAINDMNGGHSNGNNRQCKCICCSVNDSGRHEINSFFKGWWKNQDLWSRGDLHSNYKALYLLQGELAIKIFLLGLERLDHPQLEEADLKILALHPPSSDWKAFLSADGSFTNNSLLGFTKGRWGLFSSKMCGNSAPRIRPFLAVQPSSSSALHCTLVSMSFSSASWPWWGHQTIKITVWIFQSLSNSSLIISIVFLYPHRRSIIQTLWWWHFGF